MKLSIVTFHFVSNQGGVLQCLALQTFLEKQGYHVSVIDYRPAYHTVRYKAVKNPFSYAYGVWKKHMKKGLCRRFAIAALSFVRCVRSDLRGEDKEKEKKFEKFIIDHLHTEKRYVSYRKLQKDPPQTDAYITGSDQLWNPDLLTSDFDPAYFLDFAPEGKPCVAYAVSTGRELTEKELKKLPSLCKKLTAVSLREYQEDVVRAIGKDVHICIDPTLLLEEKDYTPFESSAEEGEPYIFVYGFQDTEDIHEAVLCAAEKYQCRVINGSPDRIFLGPEAEKLKNYAPDQFLTLVKNARCVVTNSFHGTAFSVIYQKDFITVAHTTRGIRMRELLKKLDLSYRLWGDPAFSFDREIDHAQAENRLRQLREHSQRFLNEAIAGKSGEEIPHAEEDRPTDSRKAVSGPKTFFGYYTDRNKLLVSASGGAASVLAEQILRDGGVVFGVRYTDDFKSACYCIAERPEELEPMKGSKYIYPEMKLPDGKMVFEAVEDCLKEGKRVLFTGLGCMVGGLQNRLRSRDVDMERLYTADLICHGPTLPEVQRLFIEELEAEYRSPVVSFTARHKKGSWKTPYVRAVFQNGKTFEKPLYETDLGFALKYYCREACYHCKYKGEAHAADLTVGDYWGIRPEMPHYNKDGVSVFFAHTKKGEELLEGLNSQTFFVSETDYNKGIQKNNMYLESARKPAFYEAFTEALKTKGLHEAVRKSAGYKVYRKVALKNKMRRALGKK